jgi:hypothetical protein
MTLSTEESQHPYQKMEESVIPSCRIIASYPQS